MDKEKIAAITDLLDELEKNADIESLESISYEADMRITGLRDCMDE